MSNPPMYNPSSSINGDPLINRAKMLLRATNNVQFQQALKYKCRDSFKYYCNNFIWINEPRGNKTKTMMLMKGDFAYQEAIADKIIECITEGKDLFIEKSRDMGISWLIMAIFTWGWLFHGWSTLVGSRTIDEVDKLNDMGALLPKVRFILKWTPPWMLPKGFNLDKHGVWKNIVNPQTSCSISGESNNPNFATGDRRKAVFFDEFSKWEYTDRDAWTSAAQTSPCRIAASTPKFRNNKFAELRKDPNITKLSLHYSINPRKDAKWAENEKTRMGEAEFAQELNLDYSGTLSTGVYTNEMTQANTDGRISNRVKYDPQLPLIIAMDFGMGDLTAVGVYQVLGWSEEVRWIDYYENFNKDIYHYIGWIKDPERAWNQTSDGEFIQRNWKDVTLVPDPNQVTNHEMSTNKSLWDILKQAGFNVVRRPVGRIEGISAVKKMFARLWINSDMVDAIDHINGYHYEFVMRNGELCREPKHDKDSHCADQFKYFAAWLKNPEEIERHDNISAYEVPDWSGVGEYGLN